MNKKSRKAEDYLIINIKVDPRSSRSGVVGPYGNALKVKLTSPPVEGKANKELIGILAKEFGIRKKDVEIISGESSRNKVVRLTGVKSMDNMKTKKGQV